MKMKKFIGNDMTQAIRMVRDEFGPDAVILSTQTVNDQVEITAAMDYDATVVGKFKGNLPQKTHTQPKQSRVYSDGVDDLKQDVATIKVLLENQVSGLIWQNINQFDALSALIFRRLTNLGLGSDISESLIKKLSNEDKTGIEQALAACLAMLKQQLLIADDPFYENGGIHTFVGTTGVGKTTLLAKVAAHFCLKSDPSDLVMMTVDTVRVNAMSALRTYGNLLGVTTATATNLVELQKLIQSFSDKKLILIDTPGFSQRDPEVERLFALLDVTGFKVEHNLVLSAQSQKMVQEETLSAFKQLPVNRVSITKTDEASNLGEVITAIIHHRLAIALCSNGRKIPEAISSANSDNLIEMLVNLGEQFNGPSQERDLAQSFSRSFSNVGA